MKEKNGSVFNKPIRIGPKGLPLRKLNYIMAGVTVFISALLLFTVIGTMRGYDEMKETTDNYIDWQQSANDLQMSSDYLTEQVRCFVETGDKLYFDQYYHEATATRRRERTMEALRQNGIEDSEEYAALVHATEQSDHLMEREYYAMRLTAEAFGYDLADFPAEIRDVTLTAEDAALSPKEKEELARHMVFDAAYRQEKLVIESNTRKSLNAIEAETKSEQQKSLEQLNRLLTQEQIWSVVLIAVVLLLILITFVQVIRPLLRAVPNIREEQPIPMQGSTEFRFLARAYNSMYEANREKRERLSYDASHDALTGLYNRRGYDMVVKKLNLRQYAYLVIDVDKFKNINDSYGHAVGDLLLAKVAMVLRERFRTDDLIFRVGGDEFVVIMVNADRQQKTLIADKIGEINDLLAAPQDDLPATSLSVGVAFGNADVALKSTVKKADDCLYKVKRQGRRGCIFYE